MASSIDISKLAGSAQAILQDESVKKVFDRFAEGCQRCYNINVLGKRSFSSVQVMRQIRSFVKYYGEEDALKIVDAAFNMFNAGKWNGKPVGTTLFASGNRWMADKFLIEGELSGGTRTTDEPDTEPTPEPEHKVKWKSFTT